MRNLEPRALWGHFAALNAVPRPSKHEERVRAFIENFGRSLQLEVQTDEVGNVLIRKPGVAGKPVVCLQSHLDMVHQKNAATVFDFATEGIRMRVDGDWVAAEGTTLGADNGIGVAAMMAVLEASDLVHPPLECLFTIDEETGMTGAKGLQGGWLQARVLLNLDTEDDRELTIGCAGGVDVSGQGSYTPVNAEGPFHALVVEGLSGGHSGMDIHLGRANANKVMVRLLAQMPGLRLSRLDGGGLRNAIPREARAIVAGTPDAAELEAVLRAEHATTDPGLRVRIEPAEPGPVLDEAFQRTLLRALYALPHGIHRLCPEVEGLVQTSNNLARVTVGDGQFSVACLTRGSVESEKHDLARAVASALELAGATVQFRGSYPGWAPRPEAGIVKLMSGLYQELFHEAPLVMACHAGLECGILGTHYPEMEMISFGPTITGAHSPDERVKISSVQKFWKFLGETLLRLAA